VESSKKSHATLIAAAAAAAAVVGVLAVVVAVGVSAVGVVAVGGCPVMDDDGLPVGGGNPPELEFGDDIAVPPLLDLQFPVPQYTPNDAAATRETMTRVVMAI
jgi:hypothetical protein